MEYIYICVCVYIYIHTYTHTHIHILHFLHPFIDGHLGSFHVLDIVSNATLNIGVHASFQIRVFVFSIYVPKNGIVGSYDNSVFSFQRPTILLSIMAAPIYIPTNSVGWFLFSTPPPIFIICEVFNGGCFDCHEVKTHYSFNLNFSNN